MPEPTKDAYQYERMLRQRIQQAKQGKTPPAGSTQYDATAPLPRSAGEDLRRDIQSLGLSIADEVGRSLAGVATETSKELGRAVGDLGRELGKASNQLTSGFSQAAADARLKETARRRAQQQAKPFASDFSSGLSDMLKVLGKVLGVMICVSVFGGIFTGITGIGSLGGLFWVLILVGVASNSGRKNKKNKKNKKKNAAQTPYNAYAQPESVLRQGYPLYQTQHNVALSPMQQRYNRYRAATGSDQVVPISRLAEAVQRNNAYVMKDLSRMIRKGIIRDGYVDNQDEMFFVDAALYRELQRKQEAAGRVVAEPTAQAENGALLQQCQDFLTLMDQHIVATQTEEEVQTQLRHMRCTTQGILDWVRSHPESAGKLRKFSSYYMPTTLKLMRSYDDVKGQNSKVAEDIRRDIGGILTTLNTAFDNLLADLLNDTALDISTEISAMQTMLAQDGLTANQFITKE